MSSLAPGSHVYGLLRHPIVSKRCTPTVAHRLYTCTLSRTCRALGRSTPLSFGMAALTVIDRDDLDALSMRAVAAELDIGTSFSVVANKRGPVPALCALSKFGTSLQVSGQAHPVERV